MRLASAISILALFAGSPVASADVLRFPAEADQQARRVLAGDSQFLPTAAAIGGRVAGIVAEGHVEQIAWTIGDGSLTTLQILAPLRDQLLADGFVPVFECATDACGGFDFRFEIDVLPEPDMHVNLGDFRYFVARRDTGGDSGDIPADATADTAAGGEFVSLIVSRSTRTGFVQLTRIGAPQASPAFTASTKTPAPDAPVIPAPTGPIAVDLEKAGHATLEDLSFPSGSALLGGADFASLADLAGYLRANPDRRVMLVGHTDAAGALDVNIALSRERAAAVMARLTTKYGIPPAQIEADGIGFLAPRDTNLTPEGRTRNRRVEVILTSTQ